jgi:hypothetical protein
MTASSITGKGSGSSVNLYKNTNRIITEPKILYAGIVRTDDQVPESSPPSETGYATVIFPKPLVGLGEEHVVVATTLNGGNVYISDMNDRDLDGDNEDDHFTDFSIVTDSVCDVFYIVTKVGSSFN